MKLRLKSKSLKNPNYFNMKIASKTFKKLIERNKENKLKNKKILLNKTEHFFLMLNKEFFKEEIKENDHDYIYREIKHMQKYHQTLVDLYGKDAYKKSIDDYSEPIKYDKKLLFNPFNKNKNENKYKIFTKEVKNMYLPKILKKNNIKLIKNNSDETNNSFNKSNITNNISTYNSLITESSSKYNRPNLTFNKYNKIKNNINSFIKTNNILNNNNGSKISISSEGNISNKLFNKDDYLMTLDNIYNESVYNQKKYKNYFNFFENKSIIYKNKFNYISKILFNK